jgi:dienelactone hydrolase
MTGIRTLEMCSQSPSRSSTGIVRRRIRSFGGCANAISFVAGAILAISVTSAAWSSDYIEERQYLRINIGGHTTRLDALFVKSVGAQGKLPIALINHGRMEFPPEALDMSLAKQDAIFIARDMALRGWLAVAVVRRGFGLSDGPIQSQGPCGKDTFMSWMTADADDIQGALEVVAKRPDADPSRVLTIGTSAGGGASVALGARNPQGLKAAINIAGGEYLGNCKVDDFIPIDFGALGSRSRVPNLWVFAKNDSRTSPAQAESMRASFSAAGGDVKLAMLEPIGNDGHAAMGSFNGRTNWLTLVDGFLRAHDLPTWQPRDVDVVLQKLGFRETQRGWVESYLSAPTEKALVRSATTGFGTFNSNSTLDAARKTAMDSCQAKSRDCAVAMENDRWIGTP